MSDATSKKSQTQTLYMGEDEKEKYFKKISISFQQIKNKYLNSIFICLHKHPPPPKKKCNFFPKETMNTNKKKIKEHNNFQERHNDYHAPGLQV